MTSNDGDPVDGDPVDGDPVDGDPVDGDERDADRVERLVDHLVEVGVLVEDERGVTTAGDFEETRGIYYDTYADVPEETFVASLAEVFGLDDAVAAERIEDLGITREEFVTYLALRSTLEDEDMPPGSDLTTMASLVAEIGMDAVPSGVARVTDEAYHEFVQDHGDVVLTVWSYPCSPCEKMKAELDDLQARAPDDVVFAGADGEDVPDLRRTYDVNSAPTTLLFRDGELVETVRGYRSLASMVDTFDNVYR